MKPTFKPGKNIAMKVPTHEWEQTVAFYGDILGLTPIAGDGADEPESARFQFGDKILWIDRVDALSQAEIWLEVVADKIDEATVYLEQKGCQRRDEIESLPDDVDGFWVSSPSNIIHLVTPPSP